MKGKSLNSRSVNDGKVTDHHALIVTENLPGKMETDEQAIYELIAERMLEAFSEKCVKDVTSVTLECAGSLFTVKGSVIKSAGWRAVFAEKEDGEDNATLPVMQDGDTLPRLKPVLRLFQSNNPLRCVPVPNGTGYHTDYRLSGFAVPHGLPCP